jgi:hypothetical protein
MPNRISKILDVLDAHGVYPSSTRTLLARCIVDALDAPDEPMELVAVAFKSFDRPSSAAQYHGASYTYAAPTRLKLTIGDVVVVPNPDVYYGQSEQRTATVVKLNACPPVDTRGCPIPIKQIRGKV